MDIPPFSAGPFTVLLEGKFLAQFDVLTTLKQAFIIQH